VGTAPALIVPQAAGRESVTIQNTGTTAVYLGNSSVTANTGILLPGVVGASVTLNTTDAIFGIAATGTQTVGVVEIGGPGTPQVTPITLPVAPAAFWSSIRLSTWSGNAFQAQRISDNVTQDFGFRGNAWDIAGADAFAPGGWQFSKVYDQSGNANDLTQATAASQPSSNVAAAIGGARPVIYDGIPGTNAKSMIIPAGLVLARNGYSMFMFHNPTVSWDSDTFWEFTLSTTVLSSLFTDTVQPGLAINNGGSVRTAGLFPRTLPSAVGYTSGVAAQTFYMNGTSSTASGAVPLTMNSGGRVGAGVPGLNFVLRGDIFCLSFFTSEVSAANSAAIISALNSSYNARTSWPNRLVYGGSSLNAGKRTSFNQVPHRLANWSDYEIYNFGTVNGQTLATQFANAAAREFTLFNPAQFCVHTLDAPSNDIQGQTFTSQADAERWADDFFGITNTGRAANTTLPFLAAGKAVGFNKVIVPTCIARGTFDANQEFARRRYNANCRKFVAANGGALSDRARDPRLSTFSDLTYFNVDQIHLTALGYAVLAAIDRAA
jgi:hypothetical protein